MNNFQQCVQWVLQYEGGYVDHPNDPGGATNMGITLRTLRAWRAPTPVTKDNLRFLQESVAIQIYREWYWNKCRCDDLPTGIDYVVFDAAVHSGPARSVMWLQETIGTAPDGIVGPITIAEANDAISDKIIREIITERLSFLMSLSTWDTFGKGWTLRLDAVMASALSMLHPVEDSEQPELLSLIGQVRETEQALGALGAALARYRASLIDDS